VQKIQVTEPSMRYLLSLLLAAFAVLSQAQAPATVPFDKEHIADPTALKMALSAIKSGDALFRDGGNRYTAALAFYQQANDVNPNNAELHMKMGLCHLNGRHHHRALGCFQQTYELDPATPRIHFLLGYAYQLNAEWAKATEEYSLHKAAISRMPDPEALYNTADRRLVECRNGKSLQGRPANARVTNLGPTINSELADYGVLITADGSRMMFTGRRPNSTGGKTNKATNEFFEDVYACTRTATGWTEPIPMAPPVNSNINDASVGLFNDGRTMIIYRDDRGAGDLFECTRQGESWSEPVALPPTINTPGNESSAWYSFDRQQLFFVSDREGGVGGQDIWVSRWDAIASTWGEATNLGPTVNTLQDEEGIYVHPDGKSIYFSSHGHTSMGGYDVFKSALVDGHWSKPENLGWPVNSPEDDLYFVMTADGATGYFSSVRADGFGEDDLYRVDFSADVRAEETASAAAVGKPAPVASNTLLVQGKVTNGEGLSAMDATIDLLSLEDGSLVASFKSDKATGEYMAVVPGGKEYAMVVRADGYLLHSENLSVPAEGGAVAMNVDMALKPLKSGQQEVMRNVFFERDKAALSTASKGELKQLVDMLTQNPALRLEIGGHTDSDGNEDHNDQLSTERAHAVVAHLVQNGIVADRLTAVGYGASKPLVTNDSAAHKAKNRRTEIRVL
jgi:outer membrane protein OmpA-like peptidoglycan-associated protein